MENLKIKVESEAESKEAQDLFFELGYVWHDTKCKTQMRYVEPVYYSSFDDMELACDVSDVNYKHKEITLPELRDLVVLKRNSIDDATHVDQYGDKWRVINNSFHFYSGSKEWDDSLSHLRDRYVLKPIEKPMKEYLIPNDGNYKYQKAYPITAWKEWIEIPEGAESYVQYTESETDNTFFLKKIGDTYYFANKESGHEWEWYAAELRGHEFILWQRATHPEELPFIDNEPSLNDQYAEIERVRQSDKVLKEILEGDLPEFNFTANKPRNAVEIAADAMQHIADRAATYDQADGERSAHKTAMAFNAITGKDLTEGDIWHILSLLKMVRQCSRDTYHRDSAEDVISYAALWAESLERDA